MKPSVADSQEFRSWLENQKKKPEYNYKAPAYYRIKATVKSRKIFRTASLLLIVGIGILIMISFVF